MSEIEKMYENAGVEKQYYYFDSADGNTYTWELNENGNDKHNMCFIGKPKIKDREFTAEKQIELIKWLARYNFIVCKNLGGWHTGINPTYDEDFGITCSERATNFGSFEYALAGFINTYWQDLTEQERTEIAEILRG